MSRHSVRVPPALREQVLRIAQHRCQACGAWYLVESLYATGCVCCDTDGVVRYAVPAIAPRFLGRKLEDVLAELRHKGQSPRVTRYSGAPLWPDDAPKAGEAREDAKRAG